MWSPPPHIDPLNAVLTLQRNLNRLTLTHNELEEMLQEERSQKEQFKNMKNNIEEERRLLDRTVEKLQREVSAFNCGGISIYPDKSSSNPPPFLGRARSSVS